MSKNGTSFSDASPPMSSFLEAMATAQKRWLQGVASGESPSSAVPPLFGEAATQWQSTLTDAVDAWSGETAPIVKQTAERMASSQSLLLQVYRFAMEAWQEAMQDMQDGEDIQTVLRDYVERMDDQIRKSTTSLNQLVQDQQASWQQFVEAMQGAGLPFSMLLSMSPPKDREASADTPAAAMFESVQRLFEFETLTGRLLDAPALGLSREFNEKVAQAFKAFQEYQRASGRYQTVVASIWSDTLQNFATALGEAVQEGDGIETLRDLSTLWTKVADQTFVRAFRTDDYIDAQNDYLEANLRLRHHQRTLAEEMQRALDQPTRSELDEVYKLLNRLRRENKELKRHLSDGPPASDDDAPSAQAADALREEVADLRAQVQALQQTVHTLTADAPTAADASDDLTVIKGIGGATEQQLQAAGITTYAHLADASHEALCDALGADISADRLNAWQRSARDHAA